MRLIALAPFIIWMLQTPATLYAVEGSIYWTTNHFSIKNSDLASPSDELLFNTTSLTGGIAMAVPANSIFWSGKQPDGMFRSSLDGTETQQIVPPCGPSALCSIGLDIEVDLNRQKVYWTESGSRAEYAAIKRANFDGTDLENVLTIPLVNPSALDLDFESGKIYWAEGYTPQRPGRIRRANFDGTEIEDLLTVGLYTSNLELDLGAGKMYWTSNNEGELWRANLDGSQSDVLMSGLSNPLAIQLDLLNNKMYWAEYYAGTIGRSNLDGTESEVFIQSTVFGVHGMALYVVPEPSTACFLLLLFSIRFGVRPNLSHAREAARRRAGMQSTSDLCSRTQFHSENVG